MVSRPERYRHGLKFTTALVLSVVVGASATAQEPGGGVAIIDVSGEALSQLHDAVGVNQAAGDCNVQSNSRVIALSRNSGSVSIGTSDKQQVDTNLAAQPDVAVTRIGGHAFRGTSGLIAINQASGAQNRQVNALAIATSINGELSDGMLAETYPDAPVIRPVSGNPVTTQREATIDSAAFAGVTGIVQLNQSSGSGNISSNRIEMSISPLN